LIEPVIPSHFSPNNIFFVLTPIFANSVFPNSDYGNYPKLTKNLERKYQDYGYFLNWQQDEAPAVLVKEKLEIYYKAVNKKWHKHAPTHMKTAARNMYYNFSYLKRKSRIAWKKHIWPVLEPIFGVPKGAAEQKKKDARGGNKKKGRRHEFRDEPDDDVF